MKRMIALLGATAFPVMIAAVSFAQQPQPPETGVVIERMKVAQGPDGAPLPPPPADFLFVTSELNFSGKVVKGAPYSAQAVTETIQVLSDGNRIVNRSTSALYRDSEGRTRREQALKILGGPQNGSEALQNIFINDPVAGVAYVLDSRSHVAHKTGAFTFQRKVLPGAPVVPALPGAETRHFEYRIEGDSGGAVVSAGPGLPAAPPLGAGGEKVIVSAVGTGGVSYVFSRKSGPNNDVTEQLGTQMIEGVQAEGTRTTTTIPVGEIGNERPIDIVNERWYSPELQTTIMSRHSDPRTGETTYKLTNISRTEPARSLFEVPSDFTIKEGMAAPLPGGVIVQPRMRKPSNPE
jgi:hypothetical protein